MASLAQDRFSGRTGQGKAARAPLSTHPAFPFIVGLWFAALLGIGSLVVPVPVIERLVEMTGLAAIVPQTAPPLGFTARALIALTCTVGGGLAGLLIARKVGQVHRDRSTPRKDRGQAAARRPISAHDELGAEGFDSPNPYGAAKGRRALAIVDEESPSEVFELAPLPGRSLPLSALDLAEADALELADAAMIADEPVEAFQGEDAPMPGFTTLADYVADAEFQDAADEDFSMAERQHFKLDTFGQTVGAPIQPRQQFVLDPAPVDPEPLEAPEAEEPAADLHFSPPSLAQPFADPDAQPDFGPDDTEEAEMDDFAEPAGQEPVLTPPTASPAVAGYDGDVEDLALVQLAQRLGSSIARRREQRAAAAAAAAPAAMPTVLAEDFDAAEAAEAAQAMAAYFGSAAAPASDEPDFAEPAVAQPDPVVTPLAPPSPLAAVPPANRQMFRPVETAPAPQPAPLANLAHIDLGEDEEDEDEQIASLAASFSLPLASKAPVAAPFAQEPEEEEEEEEVTLVAARNPAPFANPFQQKVQPFVRIENEPQPEDGTIEPAVVFPGEARAEAGPVASPASALENERALREALLNLQRMSGVA